MIDLTLEETKRLLNEIVTEYGEDHVYTNPDGVVAGPPLNPGCLNVHVVGGEYKPGCIVGTLFHKAGVPLVDIPLSAGAYGTEGALRGGGILAASGNSVVLLATVQRLQDQGVPWGRAVREAIEEVSND